MSDSIGRLTRLGFTSLAECLLSVPKGFQDFNAPIEVLPLPDTGEIQYIALTPIDLMMFSRAGVKVETVEDSFRCIVISVDSWGNKISVNVIGRPGVSEWVDLGLGKEVHLAGEVTTYDGRLQMANPSIISEDQRGRVVPHYQGKVSQVSAAVLASHISKALPLLNEASCMLLEQAGMHESEFRAETGYPDAHSFLRALHLPASVEAGLEAVAIARKLSLKAVINRVVANQVRVPVKGSLLRVDRDQVTDLISRPPYPLTHDQLKAIEEIVSDLRSPFPMNRVLSGDVGTGKSVTFMIPAAASYLAGAKVAIIAPSVMIVEQLAEEFSELFYDIPVSRMVAKVKDDISVGVVIGTTAILAAAKKAGIIFDLVIADEQHRFSVAQKSKLLSPHTNFLESTATPILRTIALVNLGGIDLSILRECPVKKTIQSRIITQRSRESLYGFVQKVITHGDQVAFIYPLATDRGDDKHSVEAAFLRFQNKLGPLVGMIHGSLPDEEKTAVIRRMKSGELKLLVASTAIEVGLTIPKLKLVVVVNADRFGTSQLHQLRGRLARKGGDGNFIMYVRDSIKENALTRLRAIAGCSDGFELAERDADARGFGDLGTTGEAQSGSARMLFWGVTLGRLEIEQGAKEAGLIPA